jgi:hypothetical protein
MKNCKRNPAAKKADKDYLQTASRKLSFLGFRENPADAFFQIRDQISNQTYRVVEPSGISKNQI